MKDLNVSIQRDGRWETVSITDLSEIELNRLSEEDGNAWGWVKALVKFIQATHPLYTNAQREEY